MKLIIDIPEEIVTAIQNGQDYRYDIHTAIAQGIPYDTSGDLISRNALKKCAIPCEIHNGALTDLCVPLYQIDNAPTVPLPDFKEGYKQAILDGKTNFPRPQGECEKCTYRIFTEKFADSISEVMAQYGITSVEELQERLRAEMRGENQ